MRLVKFNPQAFDQFLSGIGQKVQWRRSWACACVNPDSGAPDPKHQLCLGKGRLWDAPVATVTGIASQNVQLEWQNSGLYEAGDMVLSIPQVSPLWDAGQYDRILLLNSTDVFSQPFKRGAPNERLLFTPARITRCFWLSPSNPNEIIEGGLPVFDANGYPSWPNGGEPPPGTKYSLTGEKFDEYFVFLSLASDRNEHSGMRLPKRLTARKWDLFGR